MPRYTRNIILTLLVISCYCIASAQPPNITRLDKGVVIQFNNNNVKALRLQIISPRIIHIIASPSSVIKADTSLMVIPSTNKVEYSFKNENGEAIISTSAINVFVSLSTGAIRFTDANGKTLLQEEKQGRGFIPVKIEEGNSYQVSQSFFSPKDEAFYGLGQHQQGLVNYKDHVVELLQNNTEVAIPFLVSNKNYGILWENYAITQFSNGRKYQSLKDLTLYNAAGETGNLSASYVLKNDPSQVKVKQAESEIDYNDLSSLTKFPAGFSLGDGKVIWEGSLQSQFNGLHEFAVKYGGYVKFWIDGKLMADRWRQCWNPATALIPFNMERGRKYNLRIEWIPDGGESYFTVNWLRPSTQQEQNRFELTSEAGNNVNYYFVYGKNMDEIISGYRQLTGKAPIVPQWALGFWQSRERYKTQQEVLSTVKTFRERKIPLDNIVLDWQYWKPDSWGNQEFDVARFPDAKGMIDSLHELYHTHIMISVWPKFYTSTKNYEVMNRNGWMLTKNVEENRKDWLGYVSTFYDAFNPAAAKYFWQLLHDNLFVKGVDAWWMDAPEPDIHSNLSISKRKDIMYPNAMGSAIKYFNAYPLVNAKPIYEGQRSSDPNKRVFILTRSAYGGSQRYAAAVWSGDIAARWYDMKDQVAAGVNFSMSGIPYWTMDIGGFAVEHRYEHPKGEDAKEWKEQMTRWYQFGAFCPLFRVHGQFPFREIFNASSPSDTAYQSMLYYDKLRYRLMPYIYSLSGKTYFNDYTIMRGLVMDYAADNNVKSINDQFLYGPSLLINPVSEYNARSRKVYLPAGNGWYDLYSGAYYSGGQTITADAPYYRIPVFVKEGSVIPFGRSMEYTGQVPQDTLSIAVYTGKNASFTLYEDERTNYNYEKGSFSNFSFQYNEAKNLLVINDRQGNFPGMLPTRIFNIVLISKENKSGVDTPQYVTKKVVYSGKKLSVSTK